MFFAKRSKSLYALALIALAGAASLLWWQAPAIAETSVAVPPAKTTVKHPGDGPQTAVVAGGCFWGMELVFSHVKGVTNVVSGYAGGTAATANYADSSSGQTNQAESVRITYNPNKISYSDLLRIYFSVAHDPTQVNRQSPDVGHEYRSEIFAVNAGQARVARAYIKQLDQADVFDKPIATQVARLKASGFWPAESYHQNYAARHPLSLYIRVNDMPKLAALKDVFPQRFRENQPAQVAAAR
jgi:peptide-methionine (S)-S-oxide reductase